MCAKKRASSVVSAFECIYIVHVHLNTFTCIHIVHVYIPTCKYIYMHVCTHIVHVLMRDDREGRKKQARSNKQQVHVHLNTFIYTYTHCTLYICSVGACIQLNNTLQQSPGSTADAHEPSL